MVVMVILGVALRFIQESKADAAAAKLKAMINVTATVIREGKAREVPLRELVPGDIVKLSAGDMIPADVRLLSCKDLFIIQATLTGESLPVEKFDARETRESSSPLDASNLCFLGTSVESGAAQAVVVETGPQTYFGHHRQKHQHPIHRDQLRQGDQKIHLADAAFHGGDGAAGFFHQRLHQTRLETGVFLRLVGGGGVDAGNAAHDRLGLLSKGALSMARKKVIVKRLNSIQNLGAMDVLCTDKTAL